MEFNVESTTKFIVCGKIGVSSITGNSVKATSRLDAFFFSSHYRIHRWCKSFPLHRKKFDRKVCISLTPRLPHARMLIPRLLFTVPSITFFSALFHKRCARDKKFVHCWGSGTKTFLHLINVVKLNRVLTRFFCLVFNREFCIELFFKCSIFRPLRWWLTVEFLQELKKKKNTLFLCFSVKNVSKNLSTTWKKNFVDFY